MGENLSVVPSKLLSALDKNRSCKLILLMIISAFGPYLSKGLGIRLDHVIIYPFFLASLLKIAARPNHLQISGSISMVVWLFMGATLWTLLVTISSDHSVATAQVIASLENYTQSIALIILLSVATASLKSIDFQRKVLQQSCFIICVMLIFNTLVSTAQIFTDTFIFVQYFIRSDSSSGISVWRNAESMGRYSGIFNQPMEAGLAYSIGMGAWLYLFRTTGKLDLKKILLLSGLVVGGAMSVSKVFILGGLPLALLFFLATGGIRLLLKSRSVFYICLFAIILIPTTMYLMQVWSGANYFLRLFEWDTSSEKNWLELYTAGRLGSEDTFLKALFKKTLQERPIDGYGFGAFLPLDNSYIEFFSQGGLVGLMFYMAILCVLVRHSIRFYKFAPNECGLLAYLMVIVIGAGIGAPIFTINRSSIFLLVLIVLTISISFCSYVKVKNYIISRHSVWRSRLHTLI